METFKWCVVFSDTLQKSHASAISQGINFQELAGI